MGRLPRDVGVSAGQLGVRVREDGGGRPAEMRGSPQHHCSCVRGPRAQREKDRTEGSTEASACAWPCRRWLSVWSWATPLTKSRV